MYLIVSIPDLCLLPYSDKNTLGNINLSSQPKYESSSEPYGTSASVSAYLHMLPRAHHIAGIRLNKTFGELETDGINN